jgi:outer membrane protein OmpA-like peptidoglycan-associated protein
VAEVLDVSFVEAIARRTVAAPHPLLPRFAAGEPARGVVSRRSWRIGFESGSARFTPEAGRELERLLRDLLVANATLVEVHGHTDSVGSAQANMGLSEARAFAVKSWLESASRVNFPEGRVRVFAHGQENPVAPNLTPEGRAANRRVEIVLATASE